jgi:hypothetical protein
VRWDGYNGVDHGCPRLGGHRGRETITKRSCQIIATAVFERENSGAEYSIMLAPHYRRTLRRRSLETGQARLGRVFGWGAAVGTGAAGSRNGDRPACAAQTTVVPFERMIAVWTHAGKQGFNRRGQHAPRLHGVHRNRMSTALEDVDPLRLK